MFHVSQLKPAHGFKHAVQTSLPTSLTLASFPVQILDHRQARKGNRVIPQVLIHWSGSSAEDATWEDRDDLQQRFARALAWGQASFQGEELVKNLPEEDKALTPGGPSEDKVLTAEPSLKPTRTKKVNPRYHGPMWAV